MTREELDKITYDHFEFEGLECLILCAPVANALNGYVKVPVGHPLYKVLYSTSLCKFSDENGDCWHHQAGEYLDIHGGITFSGSWFNEGDWWYGFDTVHAWDIEYGKEFGDMKWTKNPAFVRRECESLVRQLIKFVKPTEFDHD